MDMETFVILLVGILIAAGFWVRIVMRRLGLPPVVGYILVGLALHLGTEEVTAQVHAAEEALKFVGEIGIVILLFRLGLECHLETLLAHLKRASILAASNVTLSGILGFSAVYYLLGFELLPSLVVGVALTATSIGVSATVWKDAGATKTELGETLLDMAVLDDIIAVLLMGLLFSLIPELKQDMSADLASLVLTNLLSFGVQLLLFLLFCFAFSYVMRTGAIAFLRRFERGRDFMLMTLSTGMIVAALAAVTGFSLALGAFFAGVALAGCQEFAPVEQELEPLQDLFTPFFFMLIGFQVAPEQVWGAGGVVLVLFAVGVSGKWIGVTFPALFTGFTFKESSVLGMSMIPRAEIGLIVVGRALAEGPDVMPEELYSGMIVMALLTCLATPLLLKPYLSQVTNNK